MGQCPRTARANSAASAGSEVKTQRVAVSPLASSTRRASTMPRLRRWLQDHVAPHQSMSEVIQEARVSPRP